MEETIDYKALFDTLREENEQLRLNILKLRNSSKLSINWQSVKGYVEKNYTVLCVVVLALYYMGSLFIDALAMVRGKV